MFRHRPESPADHLVRSILIAGALALVPLSAALAQRGTNEGDLKLTLIHIGDIHGHMVPRPNLRSDGRGHKPEGGLARMYTKIQQIRNFAESRNEGGKKRTLLLNTGDTVQGSAEALYTSGQALVDVLNAFGIDGFAPGNWEFVYGTDRFLELFAGDTPVTPWGTIAANVRRAEEGKTCPESAYVLPPYLIKEIEGVKIGLLGFTTDRGPQVVGTTVTAGLCFLSSAPGSSGTPDVS
ncbi:MAG: metallophosphoesterase, partial [Bdellovibrio bacteriovorus]